MKIWREVVMVLLPWVAVTTAVAGPLCEQRRETACKPGTSAQVARVMCKAALDGCDKAAEAIQSTSGKVAFRPACAQLMNDLKLRQDEPSRVLARYAYDPAEAVVGGVNDVADNMMKSDNIGTQLYGGVLKLMYGGIGPAIKAGKAPANCEPEYERACLLAYERLGSECR